MGVVFPRSGRGFKNFARASRATMLLEPPFTKSWIRHCTVLLVQLTSTDLWCHFHWGARGCGQTLSRCGRRRSLIDGIPPDAILRGTLYGMTPVVICPKFRGRIFTLWTLKFKMNTAMLLLCSIHSIRLKGPKDSST